MSKGGEIAHLPGAVEAAADDDQGGDAPGRQGGAVDVEAGEGAEEDGDVGGGDRAAPPQGARSPGRW